MDADLMMANIEAIGKRTHLAIAKFLVEDGQCETLEEAQREVEKRSDELHEEWAKNKNQHI